MGRLNILHSELLEQVLNRSKEFDTRWGGPDNDSKHSMVAWRAILDKPLARLNVAVATENRFEFFAALVSIIAISATAWVRFGPGPDTQAGGKLRKED